MALNVKARKIFGSFCLTWGIFEILLTLESYVDFETIGANYPAPVNLRAQVGNTYVFSSIVAAGIFLSTLNKITLSIYA